MRTLLALGLCLACSTAFAEDVAVNAESVSAYVEKCRKANGAFGPIDQGYTDAAWNYPAVRTLQLLGKPVARPDAILAKGVGTPAGHAGFGHDLFFHRHAIRRALGDAMKPKHAKVAVVYQGDKIQYYNSPFGSAADLLYKQPGGTQPDTRDVYGETFYIHTLGSLHHLLEGLACSNREPKDAAPLVEFILRRQAPDGGFVDLRKTDLAPINEDATLLQTLHAVESLRLLGALNRIKGVDGFVHSCRLDNGAYGSRKRAADVYDTWAALKTLRTLSTPPREADATRAWLNSLHNADGGFGDRPGWRSRLDSTFRAVEALDCLGGKPGANITAKRVPKPVVPEISDPSLKIFQAQFKMPVVAVDELDGLHRRGFNLLAMKTDKFELAEPLLKAIRERSLPMDVILCPEAYPHRCTHTAGAVLDHVGNFTLDPRWTDADRAKWSAADKLGAERLPWNQYRERVVAPVVELGGFVYPEQDYDLETALATYGDDRSGRTGYNAVLAGFNWPPCDFVRVFPWRERYVDRLTTIADVDAHGDLAKWSEQLDTTRTLFIAKGPTFADFRGAAAAGRVVTVIAKSEGVSGPTYYGPGPSVRFVRDRADQWRWWN